MPKHWYDDQAALDALSESLVDLIAMFPKRMVRVDELVHTFRMPLRWFPTGICPSESFPGCWVWPNRILRRWWTR